MTAEAAEQLRDVLGKALAGGKADSGTGKLIVKPFGRRRRDRGSTNSG